MSLILDGTNGLSDVDGSAATPAIRGTDANTGIFFPAADTIAFSEGGVEAARIDSSANLQFNSGYGSVATAYACRAWVNFNGTGVVAIRASGNVSSITDVGTGDYLVNFTTAMPDVNYAVALGSDRSDAGETGNICHQTLSTSNVYVGTFIFSAATRDDNSSVSVAVFR